MKIRRPKSSEMCAPGYHIVRGYERTNPSGTTSWVHTHLCKNPGRDGKILQAENLLYLFWHSKEKYPNLNAVNGFKGNHEIDSVIQFWLNYWKQQGLKFPDDVDPLLIKSLIAIESDFNPKAKSKIKGSSAFGLMQLTNQARRILSGAPNEDGLVELKPPFIRVSRSDTTDPVIDVAAGTRWLFQKYSEIPSGSEKSIINAIKNYYSWNKAGENYAKKVNDLYNKSK